MTPEEPGLSSPEVLSIDPLACLFPEYCVQTRLGVSVETSAVGRSLRWYRREGFYLKIELISPVGHPNA